MFITNNKSALNNVSSQSQREHYLNIMKNCEQYTSKPNGDQHWLCGNWILTQWKECENAHPFESWNCPSESSAKSAFEEHINS